MADKWNNESFAHLSGSGEVTYADLQRGIEAVKNSGRPPNFIPISEEMAAANAETLRAYNEGEIDDAELLHRLAQWLRTRRIPLIPLDLDE